MAKLTKKQQEIRAKQKERLNKPAPMVEAPTEKTVIQGKKSRRWFRNPKNKHQVHYSILNRFVDTRLSQNLTATELKVWVFMLSHAENGIVAVSYAKMMKDLNRCKDAISKAVNGLIKKNIIERLEIGRPERGEYTAKFSIYRLR